MLAVSGGADSLALLAFVAEARARLGRILVATVDHGLRPESAAEARFVARIAARAGLPHRTLVWTPGAARGNLSARAREARYALLGTAAREAGASCVVTAHHEDDQIETHLLAVARGEGAFRRAGMRPMRDLAPGLVLCRPLLGLPKARLVESLRARGVSWIEDPTNRDPRFARGSLRGTLADMGADGRKALRAAIAQAAAHRDLVERDLRPRLDRVVVDGKGSVRFDAEALDGGPETVSALLSRALRAVGGGARAAERAEIDRLLTVLREEGTVSRTLGGCVVTREGARVGLHREFGRAGPAGMRIAPDGLPVCFDERFNIEAPPGVRGTIVPLGRLGKGGPVQRTLPVLLGASGAPLAAHPCVTARLPAEVEPLRLSERVTWRLYRDLGAPAQNAAKAPAPVGKDFPADYLSGKSTKRVRAADPVEAAQSQSQDG